MTMPTVERADALTSSGWALMAQYAVQLAVGAAMAGRYVPTIGSAYLSTASLPSFLRAVHYWGSAILIVHGAVHIALCLAQGRAGGEGRWSFIAVLALFASTLGMQISGNLLPYDRHGVQTAAIEGTIAALIPSVGKHIQTGMLNGPTVSQRTLELWWPIHAGMLMILGLAALASWIAIHRRKSRRASPWPTIAILMGLVTLAFSIPAPLASTATLADATSYDALAGWYTWPAHGSLQLWGKVGLSWFGASGMVAILALGTVAAAFRSRLYGQIWLGLAAGYLLVCTLGFGGRFAPLTGRRDPVSAEVPRLVKVARAPQDKLLAARGAKLFEAQNCSGCHGAKGNQGISGPSLARIGEEQPELDFYVRYIKNPQSVKSGSVMPAFPNLTLDELRALGEYLRFPR